MMNKSISKVFRSTLADGLFLKNPLFISGMIIGPVIAAITTLRLAFTFVVAFSIITLCTIMICSFYSRRVVYAIRIILYTLTSSLVYGVVIMFINQFMPVESSNLGIYLPLLVSNSMIVSRTELRFFRKIKIQMIPDVFGFILGFDFSVLIFAFIREVLTYGSIGSTVLGMPVTFPILAYPFGAFILLGLLSALYRKIVVSVVLSDDDMF